MVVYGSYKSNRQVSNCEVNKMTVTEEIKTLKDIITKLKSKYCENCQEWYCDYCRAVEQLEHDMLYEPTFNQDDGSM